MEKHLPFIRTLPSMHQGSVMYLSHELRKEARKYWLPGQAKVWAEGEAGQEGGGRHLGKTLGSVTEEEEQ